MNGLLLLDKPAGISSAGATNRIKRLLPAAPRSATPAHSILSPPVYCLFNWERQTLEELMNQPKQYEATIRLGATTETDDPESPPQFVAGASEIAEQTCAQHWPIHWKPSNNSRPL